MSLALGDWIDSGHSVLTGGEYLETGNHGGTQPQSPRGAPKQTISTHLRDVVRTVDDFSISHDALYQGCRPDGEHRRLYAQGRLGRIAENLRTAKRRVLTRTRQAHTWHLYRRGPGAIGGAEASLLLWSRSQALKTALTSNYPLRLPLQTICRSGSLAYQLGVLLRCVVPVRDGLAWPTRPRTRPRIPPRWAGSG